MIVSYLKNYFLLLIIFNITSCPQQVLATPFLERCGKRLNHADYEALIGPVCSNNYLVFINCLENRLNKSVYSIDKKFLNSMDFANFEKKTSKFCNKFKKLDFSKTDCDTSHIKTSSLSNFCIDDHVRLEYLKLDKCPINVRISWFTYRDSTFRNGCQLIDPWYQIIPRYGPEVVCYKNFIENYGNMRADNTSLIEVYDIFCQQFDYESLFNCVNKTYSGLDYREFGGPEKMKKHECAAKVFVENRKEICKRINQEGALKSQSLSLEMILRCKKMIAESRISSMDALSTKYLKCLRLNSVLTKLVYDNMMKIKDVERCRANSSYFEYMFSRSSGVRYRFPVPGYLVFVLFVILTYGFM